jgi:hypothetical protein
MQFFASQATRTGWSFVDERKAPVYFGDDFSYSENKLYELILVWMQEGAVVEVDMPAPTRRNPGKTRKVYKWTGEKMQEFRDDSAIMPPRVTVLNAEGSYLHSMIVRSWSPDVPLDQ